MDNLSTEERDLIMRLDTQKQIVATGDDSATEFTGIILKASEYDDQEVRVLAEALVQLEFRGYVQFVEFPSVYGYKLSERGREIAREMTMTAFRKLKRKP